MAEVPTYSVSNLVQDKYIGLALAVSSSIAIGTSFIITKKGLIDAARRTRDASSRTGPVDSKAYLRNPIWWAGMITMAVGEIANFTAYAFAPPVLVTPLGALSVLIGAILASIFLKEELGRIGSVGCALCLLGSLVIVLHAPEDKDIKTVDEILSYAMSPGFVFYSLFVGTFSVYMIYKVAPIHGTTNPLVYLSICSLVGSISVMAIKGLGVALKLTFAGNNQLTHAPTYFFAIVVGVCIATQMNYFNKALDTFSTNVVNPIYYVFFSSATILASLILFQGLNTSGGVNSISLICGFLTTFLGVYLLNLSRTIPSSANDGQIEARQTGAHHRRRESEGFLERGMLNPRISISSDRNRASFDSLRGGDSDEEGFPMRSKSAQGQRDNSISSYNHQSQGLNGHGAYITVTDTDEVLGPTGTHQGRRTSGNEVVFDIGNDEDDLPRGR